MIRRLLPLRRQKKKKIMSGARTKTIQKVHKIFAKNALFFLKFLGGKIPTFFFFLNSFKAKGDILGKIKYKSKSIVFALLCIIFESIIQKLAHA